MPFARIAITLPKDLLAATDRGAKELERSRSRVIADAIRALLAAPAVVPEVTPPAAPAPPDHRLRFVRGLLGMESVACTLHGYARATDDVDILIESISSPLPGR